MARLLLIVSDDHAARDVLKQNLQEEYDIELIEDEPTALSVLKKDPGQVSGIIIDYDLTGTDICKMVDRLRSDHQYLSLPIVVISEKDDMDTKEKILQTGANGFLVKPVKMNLMRSCLKTSISMCENAALVNTLSKDKLTGLMDRDLFFDECDRQIRNHEAGYYMMSCLDIENFKVLNDQYGMNTGDQILKYVAVCIRDCMRKIGGFACRFTADRFAILYPARYSKDMLVLENHRQATSPDCINRSIRIRIGRYFVKDSSIGSNIMFERATVAEESIKGRYDVYIAEYDDSMRTNLLREQQIVGDMHNSLERGEFVPFLQPQYNHETGMLVGAEALTRWKKGDTYISPGEFIPIFERNGFIYELDKYIWEQVCILLRRWIDEKKNPVAVSVNISRIDLLRDDCYDILLGLLEKYQIPVDLLRLEVTESAFSESSKTILARVNRLISYGFTVEIDDFGSGYSSLNTLKDVPASILKLDMKFFENTENSQRGGNIIESVVRMAKWLGMAVIEEGVEEKSQADYLRSIGCFYIQGYYYARPMPVTEYEELLSQSRTEMKMTRLKALASLNNNEFWNPKSMETLIFNSYVGGAFIFEYCNGKKELLRVNEQYQRELGSLARDNIPFSDMHVGKYMDNEEHHKLDESIEEAIRTQREVSFELKLCDRSAHPANVEYIRYTIRVIANTGERYLFYCVIVNMTSQRVAEAKRIEAEKKEMQSAEQLQIIMRNIGGGVSAILVDDEGHSQFVFSNERYFELYGYTREEVTRQNLDIMSRILPEDFDDVMNSIRRMKKDRKPTVINYRCRKKNGEIVYLRVNSSLMSMEGYGDDVITSVVTDITEQRLLSDQLSAIIDNINGAVSATVLNDGKPELLFVNERFYEILGYTREQYEAECANPYGPLHPDDRERTIKRFTESADKVGKYTLEYRIIRRDGSVRWIQNNISILTIFGIRNYVQLAVANDVTELRESQLQDKINSGKLKTLLNHAGNGITAIVMHKDSNEFLFASDKYFEIIGCSREQYEEKIQKDLFQIIHPNEREYVREQVLKANIDREDAIIEFRIIRDDKSVVWIKCGISVTDLPGIDDPVQVAVFTDITQEKEANDQLHFLNESAHDILAQPDSEKAVEDTLYRIMNYFCGERAYIIELDYEKQVTNNTYEVCKEGVSREKDRLQNIPFELSEPWFQILRKGDFVQIADVDSLGAEAAAVKEILQMQKIHSLKIAPIMRENDLIGYVGVDNPTEALNQLERLRALGDYIAILLTHRDMTGLLRDEQEAIRNEQERAQEKQKELLDNLPCGAALYEFDGKNLRFIHINRRYWKLVHREPESCEKLTVIGGIHPEDQAIVFQEIQTAIRQNRDAVCDLRIRDGESGYRAFHVVASITTNAEGNYILYTSYLPISNKIMSLQEMLPIALSTMMEASEDVSYIKDKDLRYICCSHSSALRLGLKGVEDVVGKTDVDLFESHVAEKIRRDDMKIIKSGQPTINYLERFGNRESAVRLAETSKYPIINSEGEVIGIYCISRDVTEDRERESMLKLLTGSIPGGLAAFSIQNNKFTTLFYNDGYYRVSGYTKEEFIAITKNNPFALVLKEDLPTVQGLLDKIMRELKVGEVEGCVFRSHTKDGGYKWMNIKSRLSQIGEDQYVLNVVQIDITEQKEIEESLRLAEEEYHIAAKHSGRTIARYYIASKTLKIAADAASRLELPECIEDVPYSRVRLGKISAETANSYVAFYEKIMNGDKEGDVMFQKHLPNGWRWISGHFTTLFSKEGKPVSALISYIDVTDQYEKEAIYKKWQQSLEDRPRDSYSLFRCDLGEDCFYDSTEGTLIQLGDVDRKSMSFDEYTASYANRAVHPEDRAEYVDTLRASKLLTAFYQGKKKHTMEYREIVAEGEERWIRRSVDLVEKPDSSGIMAYLMFENIDESKRAELNTQTMAETDSLTGLLNRKAFVTKMGSKIAEHQQDTYFAFMILDVDLFKSVNDTLGHAVGDRVLIEIGKTIQSIMLDCDLVGRLGGDEFIVCMCNVPNRDIIQKKARRIWKMTHKELDKGLKVSTSIGIAVFPDDGADFDSLYQKADQALYRVKEGGKDNYGFYQSES